MQIVLAKHAGFCFGVKRAVEAAFRLSAEGKKLCTLGDLIHNQEVVGRLAEQGIRSVKSIDEIGDENVIIRSHGVSPDCLKALEGKEAVAGDVNGRAAAIAIIQEAIDHYQECFC